ncbi:hypothetical protein ACFQX6_30395 [Streptosporangium lutulentum]
MRAYLGNRIGLAVTGTVLTTAGFYGFLRGWGGIAGLPGEERILSQGSPGRLAGHPWAGWLVALTLVVLALLAIRWLLHAVGWRRWGRRAGAGVTTLGGALKEIEGLGRVRVRLVRDERVRIGVSCAPTADVGKLVARLNKDAVGKVRRTLGHPELGAVVRLHVRRR